LHAHVFLPVAAWYVPLYPWLGFALAERKTHHKKKVTYGCDGLHMNRRLSPVSRVIGIKTETAHQLGAVEAPRTGMRSRMPGRRSRDTDRTYRRAAAAGWLRAGSLSGPS